MKYVIMWAMFFFFQAEDGIRDTSVTGVQTCALPISLVAFSCGNDPAPLRSCSSDSPKTCETAARSICPEPSSTPRSAGPKEGALPLALLDAAREAVHVASASPYEPHLVPATLDARFLADLPTRLIGDRGYDSDALDERLMTQYGIEMIAAHRRAGSTVHAGWPCAPPRADAGRSNGSSRGSTTRVVSSRAGNVMSTTSWACCISPAPESSSGIYELTSSLPVTS